MTTGVYTITCISTNKIYVGCGTSIEMRFNWHRTLLRRNKHPNGRLQNAWNKYEEKNFLFEVLEVCDKEYIFSQEHYWCIVLNSTDRKFGFNLRPTHPEDKKLFSQETRDKISKGNKGKIISVETRLLKSKVSKGYSHNIIQKKSVNQYDLQGNFIKTWDSIKEAHKGTKSSRTSIKLQCESNLLNIPRKKTTCKFIWKYFKNKIHDNR